MLIHKKLSNAKLHRRLLKNIKQVSLVCFNLSRLFFKNILTPYTFNVTENEYGDGKAKKWPKILIFYICNYHITLLPSLSIVLVDAS